MVAPDSLLANMRNLFSTGDEFSDIAFIYAYTGTPKASPLKRATVAVSIKHVKEQEVDPVYSEADEEAGEVAQLLYNHTVDIRMRMDIHVPQTQEGIACYEIYTRLGRYLMDQDFGYPFVGVGCEGLEYSRDMGAFTLYAYVDLKETSIAE